MLRLLRHLVFLVSLAFIAGLARDARAGDTATAEALFTQGKKLMGEKKYAEACAKFAESQKLDPGLGTQTNLAICYESLGRTATAWSLYLGVASQAKATNQGDREKKARDAARAIEPKLSKLTILVELPAANIEVKRNGEVVGEATWATPVPIDPGDIKITAVAPSHKLWEKSVTIDKPGETTITVPELEKAEPPGYFPAPTGTVAGYSGGPPPLAQTPRMKRRSTGMMVGGIIMMPVGVITLLVGGVAYAIDTAPQYDPFSGETFAGNNGVEGITTMVAGAILVAGGITLTVIGAKKIPADDNQALEACPVPRVKLGLGNAQLQWQF
jgi:hypothetical protein